MGLLILLHRFDPKCAIVSDDEHFVEEEIMLPQPFGHGEITYRKDVVQVQPCDWLVAGPRCTQPLTQCQLTTAPLPMTLNNDWYSWLDG